MLEIRQTEIFSRALRKLRDRSARARIQVRIDRLALGLPGQARDVAAALALARTL